MLICMSRLVKQVFVLLQKLKIFKHEYFFFFCEEYKKIKMSEFFLFLNKLLLKQ